MEGLGRRSISCTISIFGKFSIVETMTKLTNQEDRIVRMLADGKTSKEVCAELNISYRTLANHLQHASRKFDIYGAIRKKLIESVRK